jgi:hypothetical protein
MKKRSLISLNFITIFLKEKSYKIFLKQNFKHIFQDIFAEKMKKETFRILLSFISDKICQKNVSFHIFHDIFDNKIVKCP